MTPNNKKLTFQPDYAVVPGSTLLEVIESLGMTQAELAERTGRPVKTINEIIKGKASITSETALQFERVLGVPASFWNNLEKNYQETTTRINEAKKLEVELNWLKILPIRALIKEGWIKEAKDKVSQLQEVLNFFGVATPKELESVIAKSVAFRQSKAWESDRWTIAAWLRKGEQEAQKLICEPFDAEKFTHNLKEIRNLTKENINSPLCETWRTLCSQAGVALLFIHELPKLRVNGATYWLSKDKAVIQLTLRHKVNDIFWFTFFHEAGHILLHGKKDVFLENKELLDQQKEKEADDFAGNFLIPIKPYEEFVRCSSFTRSTVKEFAHNIGIAPGIVVGRLQHDGNIPISWLNDLKDHLAWS